MKGALVIFCMYFPRIERQTSRWIYGTNVAVDANFRLKLKDRGVMDPEFGPGWAYFVKDDKYKAEIVKHPQPIEVRNF